MRYQTYSTILTRHRLAFDEKGSPAASLQTYPTFRRRTHQSQLKTNFTVFENFQFKKSSFAISLGRL